MNIPHGRVTRLSYRDTQPKLTVEASVLDVTFVAPDGETYTHSLDNREWLVSNPALQLMALNGFKPSDIEGTSMDTGGWSWLLPLTYADDEYKLSQAALQGGVAALRKAEWFDADDGEKLDSGPSAASGGKLDKDPSGGADKTGEESNSVTAELTPEENTGVNVAIE